MPVRKAKRRDMPASEAEPISLRAIAVLFCLSVAVVYVCMHGLPRDTSFLSNAKQFNASKVTRPVWNGVHSATKFLNETRLMLSSTVGQAGHTLWQISGIRHALVSLFCGGFLVVYGWYILYWDSYIPGAFPPSPRWPWKYSRASGDCITLNHAMVLLLGPIAAARMYRELHGSWGFS